MTANHRAVPQMYTLISRDACLYFDKGNLDITYKCLFYCYSRPVHNNLDIDWHDLQKPCFNRFINIADCVNLAIGTP